MMTVLGCIAHEHTIWLVIVAGLLCCLGAWVTARLLARAAGTVGLQRVGWYFLTALAAGVAIWCTHFIAMLGFRAGVPVSFDPVLTIASLLIAVAGSTAGFVLAGGRRGFWSVLGGVLVGLSIAAMHYTGMMAYRVQGIVSWDWSYLVASVVLSVGLSAAALYFASRPGRHAGNLMAGIFALAILSLHFTGMTAFRVTALRDDVASANPEQFLALALAIAGMAVLIVAAGLVSYFIDDRTRAEAVEHLRRMALSDTLTGLPNRASFNERLDHEISLADAEQRKIALIGIDLNRFKEINDLRGHHAGDEVLRVLGRRMKGLLREEDGEFVARVGGDEFVAICRVREKEGIAGLLGRLEAALTRPVRVDEMEVVPGASFGVAFYPDDAADRTLLIGNADLAMYRAKSDLSRSVCYYEPGMDEIVRARRSMAADLRDALALGQLSIHYQVQTAVQTGQVRGYEALLRWEHPQRGFIPPMEFIPVAEENGLILKIGEWVLRHACAAATAWEPPYKVAVNLSALQFAHKCLPRLVRQVLEETGLAPERLELELTESTIFADRDHALRLLHEIKALGVSIALDDFGTGYSSLDVLRSFPFDRLKIDGSFVRDAENNPQTFSIVRAVLSLGRSLGIPVLAEGIETQGQLSMLSAEGCEEVQGFLLGEPAPLERIVGTGQISIIGGLPGLALA